MGDAGTTSIIGGQTVPKDDLIIDVLGTIDEANSALGLARSLSKNKEVIEIIEQIQQDLITVGSEVASTKEFLEKLPRRITQDDIVRLEKLCDAVSNTIEPITHFILPGKTPASAALDLSRAIVRRAEREMVKLLRVEKISKELYIYINRLSSLLWALARIEEQYGPINVKLS